MAQKYISNPNSNENRQIHDMFKNIIPAIHVLINNLKQKANIPDQGDELLEIPTMPNPNDPLYDVYIDINKKVDKEFAIANRSVHDYYQLIHSDEELEEVT